MKSALGMWVDSAFMIPHRASEKGHSVTWICQTVNVRKSTTVPSPAGQNAKTTSTSPVYAQLARDSTKFNASILGSTAVQPVVHRMLRLE